MQSTKGLKAVCIFDPAIARRVPQDELVAYARSRDMSGIEKHVSKGDPPSVYHYRRLSRSVMDRFVDVQPSDEGKSCAAFQYGITAVDNKREEDGARINWTPTGRTDTPDGDIFTLTENEMTLFSRAEQIEMGTVIWNASFLPRWAALGPAFPVPPTSLALWARLDLPSAETNQSTAPPSKPGRSEPGSAKPPPTAPAPASGGSASDAVTAAPAAGKT